jgi:sugar phosphate isomerase/epimerase
VGVQQVGPGGMMNDCRGSLEAWLKGAKRLDTLGEKLRGVGLNLAFHNHDGEFKKFEGDPRCMLDILFENTRPENLHAELDLAWVHVAGADPAAYIRKYKGRCPTVHAKEVVLGKNGKKQQFKPLGQGEQNWPEIFAAGNEAGIEWYIYEQDSGEGSPFDFAHASYEFLAKNMR